MNEFLSVPRLIKVSQGLTGKMAGIPAISTSSLCNPNCIALQGTKGTVCEHCYTMRYLRSRRTVESAYRYNTELLTQSVIPVKQLPFINATICRLESFGDIVNATHLENYMNIVRKNSHCMFSLFTKNYSVVFSYFANHSQPRNLSVVVSSLYLNQPYSLTGLQGVKIKNMKVFTVYTKDFAEKNSVAINCGANRCIECQRCYRRNNEIVFINELLK